jgi:hypothetical protein
LVAHDDQTAEVLDCAIDDTILYDIATGTPLDSDVQTVLWRTSVMLDGGQWKVSNNTIIERVDGVGGCASLQ